MRATLARWGNSLAVRLPKGIAASVGMREGAALDLTVEGGALVLRRRPWDIGELVAAIEGAERPPLLLDDGPMGDEVW